MTLITMGNGTSATPDLIDESTGQPLATNTSDGTIIQDAVEQYLEINPLNEYGFSGWIGPEPHGGLLGNSGFIRDPLIANRTVQWLEDRYRRRNQGDSDALKQLVSCKFCEPARHCSSASLYAQA